MPFWVYINILAIMIIIATFIAVTVLKVLEELWNIRVEEGRKIDAIYKDIKEKGKK